MSDRLIDLARSARAGGRPELESLLTATVGLIHALARAKLGDGTAAHTVAADALCRVAAGFERLREPRAYPHWVYRITQRCVARRGGQRRRVGLDRAREPVDEARGPVEVAVRLERLRQVRAEVAALPARLREPVLLHFVEGFSYREISAVIGIGLGSVGRRMAKALAALERRLGEDAG